MPSVAGKVSKVIGRQRADLAVAVRPAALRPLAMRWDMSWTCP